MEPKVFGFVGNTCTLVLVLSGLIKGHHHRKSASQERPSRDQVCEQPRPDLEIASSTDEARDSGSGNCRTYLTLSPTPTPHTPT